MKILLRRRSPMKQLSKQWRKMSFFSYDSAEEMITDSLGGDESWKNQYKNIGNTETLIKEINEFKKEQHRG
jgi:hypothetical protein